MTNTLALLAFTLLLAAGQLLFKKLGLELRAEPAGGAWRLLFSPVLYAAFSLYGFATLLWIWILSRVPLSRAYPYVALGVVFVPLASLLFFGERVRPLFWVGTGLIVMGIIVTQMDVAKG